jgi:hypothetical protein
LVEVICTIRFVVLIFFLWYTDSVTTLARITDASTVFWVMGD